MAAVATALGACGFPEGSGAKARALYTQVIEHAPQAQVHLEQLEQMAREGGEQAAFYAGLLYDPGLGEREDLNKAAQFYAIAAKRLAAAQFNLALLMFQGARLDGPRQPDPRALLQQAADAGRPEATLLLATVLTQGLGPIAPEPAQAAVQFERALSATGDPRAALGLGVCFQEGRGCPVDLSRARELLMRAANEGLPEAQSRLADLAQDGVRAAQWRLVAASQDPDRLPAALAALGTLSQADRDAARQAAQLWVHVHTSPSNRRPLITPLQSL